MCHLFYSSSCSRDQKRKKTYLKAKIRKRHFNTITFSKDLSKKYFRLPSQQFSKDILTGKKDSWKRNYQGKFNCSSKNSRWYAAHYYFFIHDLPQRPPPKKSNQTDRQWPSIMTL